MASAGIGRRWAIAAFAAAAAGAVPTCFLAASLLLSRAPPPQGYPIRIDLGRGDYPVRIALPPARGAEAGAAAGAAEAIEFDLAGATTAADGGGSAIALRKQVRLDGAEAGSATVRVSAGSTLSISADELRALLARAGHGDLAGQIGAADTAGGFVEFEALRRQGLDVRYDAEADRIAIAL